MSTLRIADAVGRVLGGQYRLIRPLGSGASAYVYVGEDVTIGRRVAVKVLHPGLADDQAFLRRFREGAQIIAALEHLHIQRVYDWGEDGGSPYLVSELLEGGSLRALLDRSHRLSWSQATAVGWAAAQALEHARRSGVVHGDIKPANLLFDGGGRLCVADFGLARALAAATWVDPAAGRYAAPEQALGLSVDSRADAYALALVLTEALTGAVPFSSDTPVAALMARTKQPLEGPDGAGPLAPILEAAGTIDPNDRLDPLGLGQALESLASTLPAQDPLPLAGLPGDRPDGRPGESSLTGPVPRRTDPDQRLGFVHQPPAVPVVALPVTWIIPSADPFGADDEPAPVASDAGGEIGPGQPEVTRPEAQAAPAVAGQRAVDGGEPTMAWRLDHDRPSARLYDGADDWDLSDSRTGAAPAYPPDTWPVQPGVAASGWDADEAGAAGWTWDERAPGFDLDQEPTSSDDYPDEPGRHRWLAWLAAVVALFLLSAGGTAVWIVKHQPATPLAVVPSLRGDTIGQARQLLGRDHLRLVVAGRSYDAHARRGTIIGPQAPTAGRRVRRNAGVAVTVSRGPKPVAVPSLRGDTRYGARRRLAAIGLKIATIRRTTSVNVPVDDIISSTPSKGTLLPGQSVAIVISTGKPKVVVPLLQGQAVDSYAAAAAALKKLHFLTAEELVYNDTVPAGEVIVTDPAPHASALYGTTVTVLVSKGADLVQIPDVHDDTVAAADKTLAAYGFVVSGVTGSPDGTVLGTDPAQGSLKLYGSSVQIITTRTAHRQRRK